MLDRKYAIKIYKTGHHHPICVFYVRALRISSNGSNLNIDGTSLFFGDECSIGIEQQD